MWPEAERKLWVQLLEGSFKLIYTKRLPTGAASLVSPRMAFTLPGHLDQTKPVSRQLKPRLFVYWTESFVSHFPAFLGLLPVLLNVGHTPNFHRDLCK